MARRGRRTGLRAVIGMVCVLFGVLASLRPFASVAVAAVVLSIGLLIGAGAELIVDRGSLLSRRLLAAVHVAAAAVIGLWPGITLPVAAAVAGMVLVADGALEFWTGFTSGGSWIELGEGAVTLAIGAVVTLWAEPVLLPVVVALGWRLVLVGAGLLIDLWYPPNHLAVRTGPRRAFGRAAALAVAVVLTAGAVVADPRTAVPAFYDIELPASARAGDLARAAEYPGASAGSSAFRLLYATTEADGTPVAASAVLYVPSATRAAELPLVVWLHGTTGIARSCAPSLLGEESGGLTVVPQLLAAGYAVLAPDFVGLGASGTSSYLVGAVEGRAVLDGIRAAGRVPGVRVGSSVLWGYEQGGHAALWADQLAPGYAPDVRIAGVVAVAPATDLAALFSAAISAGRAGTLGTQLVLTYSARHPDVRPGEYVAGAAPLLEEIRARCEGERGPVGELWAQATGFDQAWTMPAASPLAARLAENTPTGTFRDQVLVVQGAADTVVPAVVQDDWVQDRCSAGARLTYRKLAGLGHADVVAPSSAAVSGILAWIGDRFDGRIDPAACE
jgi:uncharacterized membrane protein HdeD (DUF308 family)